MAKGSSHKKPPMTNDEKKARASRRAQKYPSDCGCKNGLVGPPGRKKPCRCQTSKTGNSGPVSKRPKNKSSQAGRFF